MKWFSKNIRNPAMLLFLLAFTLGCLSHYFITTGGLFASEDNKVLTKKIIVKDIFNDDFDNTFKAAQKLMLDMNSQFDSELGSRLAISEREDENFKYIDVKADELHKNALKIDINNGMVSIVSEVKNTKKEDRANTSSYTSYSSQINQSISVPEGVDEKKADVIKEKDFLTIRFPKVKMMI